MKTVNKDINWELAARVLSGEASDEERSHFDLWLAIDDNQIEWNNIAKSMGEADSTLIAEKVDVEQAWRRIKPITVSKNNRTIRMFRAGAVAAAASVIIAVAMYLNPSDKIASNEQFRVAQTSNTIEQLDLNDGSLIDLNRNSSIRYPSLFSAEQRALTLSGEAFFDVASDKDRPFVISTQQIQIKVIGTAFNVKALPNTSLSEVSVHEGIVSVSSMLDPNNSLTLTAGDKAIFNAENNTWVKMQLANNNYIAWKTKKIAFKNEELPAAIALIEDVYYVKLNMPHDFDASSKMITTTFDKYTIEHIVMVLNGIYGVEFTYQKE